MIREALIAGLGGFAGTALRYIAGVATRQFWNSDFPLATFAVNIVGCLIIGAVFGISERTGALTSNQVILLTTGFCGGFTTFSAFANESLSLITSGQWILGVGYILASVVAGIACVWIGRAVII